MNDLILGKLGGSAGIDVNLTLDDLAQLWPGQRVLFIHGADDTVIPPAETIELYQAAGNPDNLVWIVPGAGHVKAYRHRPDEYVRRVTAFFQRYIS